MTSLGAEVVGLMLIGFFFSLLSVRGVTWAIGHPNRKRKLPGWMLLMVGYFGSLTFYGWAMFGDPARLWLGP